MTLPRSFLQKSYRFLFVGALGFLTDAGVLWLMTNTFRFDPYTGRLVSFAIAVVVTWILNSRFTFKIPQKRTKRHFGAYVTIQTSSFMMNYAIYSALVWQDIAVPLLALALAAVIAMFYSFMAMNFWVFREPQT